MLVKGAGTLINHQGAKKKSSSRAKSGENSFQSMLDKAQTQKKRKPLQKVAKKPVPKQRKQDVESNEVDQKQLRVDNKPKKKLNQDSFQAKNKPQNPAAVQKLNQTKSEAKVGENSQLQALKAEQAQTKQAAAAFAALEAAKNGKEEVNLSQQASQILKDGKLGKENLLSTNSSENVLKSLEKNIEQLEKFEKSFSDHVLNEVNKTKMQKDINSLKTLSGKGNVPIQPEMKSEIANKSVQFGETVELQNGQGLQGLKLNSFTDDRGASSEQGADMNSTMFAQGVEQENQITSQSSFVEAMNEVDTQGQRSEKIENMQSIIKQARAFVKDGGGSMHIELAPEGMGKIHLKVAVQDGQVNVEMLADNQTAKRALEDGLVEIKNALEGHKLLVDTLKVEMSQDYQKDFSDLRDHMNEQANRDFAEQFLGQFRQERDAKYGGVFDGFKNFNPGQKEPELNLSTRSNAYMGQGKGQSLNIVA